MLKLLFMIIFAVFMNQNSYAQTMFILHRGSPLYGFITIENKKLIELRTLNDTKVVIPIENIKSREVIPVNLKSNTGLVLKGTIIAFRKLDFDFLTNDSINLTLNLKNIVSFNSENDAVNSFLNDKLNTDEFETLYYDSKDSIYKDFKTMSFTKFGLAYGTPAEFNIFYGYNNQKTCLNISAGILGIQGGVGINAYTKAKVEFNLLLGVSYLQLSKFGLNTGKKFYLSGGLIAELYLYGFHLQLGISKVQNLSGALINLQIGYAYRFTN